MSVLSGNYQNDITSIRQISNNVFPNQPVMVQLTEAQAILESGLTSGGSELSKPPYNNLFGIKWPSDVANIEVAKQHGRPVLFPTHEVKNGKTYTVNAYFIAFNSIEDCIQYRAFMFNWEMYKNVKEAKTFEDAAKALQADHYATDPHYFQQLMNIYTQIKLDKN